MSITISKPSGACNCFDCDCGTWERKV